MAKCNTDGACIGNPWMSAYGFCIRDNKSDLIYARAKGLGFSTNTEAASIAIKETLEYCYENDFKDFIIETDSLSLKQMKLRLWGIPWELAVTIEEIREYIQFLNVTITHIFREGNAMAKSLVNGEV
ncbi:hypothetical protein P3L10_022755 [Capsicum annuum]